VTSELFALQYRFGRPNAVELRHPHMIGTGSATSFAFAHYSRSQVNHDEVAFSINDVRYAVFDRVEEGTRRSGVSIGDSTGKETVVLCKSRPTVNRLSQLKSKLPCDKESALNLGACPTIDKK
jgi:CO/xanthine dehydrogenase Mo-binding subunit